MYVINL